MVTAGRAMAGLPMLMTAVCVPTRRLLGEPERGMTMDALTRHCYGQRSFVAEGVKT